MSFLHVVPETVAAPQDAPAKQDPARPLIAESEQSQSQAQQPQQQTAQQQTRAGQNPSPSNDLPPSPMQQNQLQLSGELDASKPRTVLHLASGHSVVLPTELLLSGLAQRDAPPSNKSEDTKAPSARQLAERGGPGGDERGGSLADEQVLPLVAEEAQIGKQTVTTGTVRLHRGTEQFTQTVGLPLTRTEWDVQRVPIGQVYPERPEVRQEGDTMIFPLIEERLVAKREYMLIEEVRVRQVATTTERSATVELKRDVLEVERTPTSNTDDAQQPQV